MKKSLLAAILAALIILLGAWALADEDTLAVTVNGHAACGQEREALRAGAA